MSDRCLAITRVVVCENGATLHAARLSMSRRKRETTHNRNRAARSGHDHALAGRLLGSRGRRTTLKAPTTPVLPRVSRPRSTWRSWSRTRKPRASSTSSRCRPTWANYGNIIKAFEDKYDIKVNSDQPDTDSQTEIDTAKRLQGQPNAPDVFDLGQSVALANTDMFAPYQVQTWDDIPDANKDPKVSGSTTTAATSPSATTPTRCRPRRAWTTCSARTTRATLPSTATRPRPAPVLPAS